MSITQSETEDVKKCLELIKNKDPVTYNHSMRVGALVREYWERKGLEDNRLEDVTLGAYLHDLGKVYERDSTLNHAGKLDAEQLKEMRKHPGYGILLLPDNLSRHSIIKNMVLQHHESYDPKNAPGYPFNVEREQFSVYAQSLAVADVFDACLNKRQYKDGMDLDQVLDIITTDQRLNPWIAAEFTSMVREKVVNNEITGEQDPLKELKKLYIKEREEKHMGVLTRLEERIKELRARFEPTTEEAKTVEAYVGKTGPTIELTREELKLAMEQTKRELKDLQEAQKAILEKAKETGIFSKQSEKSYRILSDNIFKKSLEYHDRANEYASYNPIKAKEAVDKAKEKASLLARNGLDKVLAGIGAIRQLRDNVRDGLKEVREQTSFNMMLVREDIGTRALMAAESINRNYLATVYSMDKEALSRVENKIERLEEKFKHRATIRDSIKNVFNAIAGRDQTDASKASLSQAQQDRLSALRQAANELRGDMHNLSVQFEHSKEMTMEKAGETKEKFGSVGKEAEEKAFDDHIKNIDKEFIDRTAKQHDEQSKDTAEQDIGDDNEEVAI